MSGVPSTNSALSVLSQVASSPALRGSPGAQVLRGSPGAESNSSTSTRDSRIQTWRRTRDREEAASGPEDNAGEEWGSRPPLDAKVLSESELGELVKERFGVKDLSEFLVPVRNMGANEKCHNKNGKTPASHTVPRSYKAWGTMTTHQRIKFLGVCYSLQDGDRKQVVLKVDEIRQQEMDDEAE